MQNREQFSHFIPVGVKEQYNKLVLYMAYFIILLKLNVQSLYNMIIHPKIRIIINMKEADKSQKNKNDTKLITEADRYRKNKKRTEFKFEGLSE